MKKRGSTNSNVKIFEQIPAEEKLPHMSPFSQNGGLFDNQWPPKRWAIILLVWRFDALVLYQKETLPAYAPGTPRVERALLLLSV